MWGGGMMFNEIVVQAEAKPILDELGVTTRLYTDDYYTADAVECVATLTSKAIQAGARIFNLISIEDVMLRENRVTGLVLNWSAVEMGGLHVDPLTIRTRYVIEATGHPVEVMSVIERKVDADLLTPSGTVTHCPYKGRAVHFHGRIGDAQVEDVAWSYPTPLPESERIAGLMAFYDGKVTVEVDGQPQGTPAA